MHQFINPYNFVPLSEEAPQTVDKNTVYRGEEAQKALLSGWMDVKLDIKTPLIIPDGAHPRFFEWKNKRYVSRKAEVKEPERDLHLEYDFLKLYSPETGEKEYAISGSELRGLIRSVYETVTNSCMPLLLSDKPMSQRVPLYGALNKRGLLGYDGQKWVLYGTQKELEEVIVVPVYEVNGNYYVESLENVRRNKDNNIRDENGELKYAIMKSLDYVDGCLKNLKWKGKTIQTGAKIVKCGNQKPVKWQLEVGGQVKVAQLTKKPGIDGYLFVRADGTAIEKPTGSYVVNKGWLQYNVPVDITRVYHVAYLTRQDIVYDKWKESTATGDAKWEKNDDSKAQAYKKLWSALKRDGTSGRHTNQQCNEALKKALEKACRDTKQLVPVYYFIVNGGEEEIVYMSGAAAGRIAQRRKWAEIMKGHTPCEKELCPACLLFGTIKDGGMKGHVRFSDAYVMNSQTPVVSKHTLRVLASPRTTAFEFYLKKPVENATYWNYDFYGVKEAGANGKGTRTNYYHLEKALPRGRKMYWHHKPIADADRKDNMTSTVESMDAGSFGFKVYFNQITRAQLADLIWTITLGENKENSRLQHKLGHAKPLGYGSVKLTVTGGAIRQFSKQAKEAGFGFSLKKLSEEINLEKIEPTFDVNTETIQSLLVMCNADATGNGNVDYPRKDNNGQIFEWFASNRINADNLKVLPKPTDKVLSLKGSESKEEVKLKVGDIVMATFDRFAEKREDNYRFGVNVRLPGGMQALLHKKNALQRNLEKYENSEFKVKILEITVNKGKKQYSVTDKF